MNKDYQHFIKNNALTPEREESIKKECLQFKQQPLISIIVPVYNVAPQWLNKCIESVTNQFYHNWELCLYDDCSSNTATTNCLKQWEGKDKRIKIQFGQENKHISLASNEAVKMTSGEFIGLLDHDDELTADALFEVVKQVNKTPSVDFIFSDEDKIEMDGTLSFPHFKPGVNLEYFAATNYICHFSVIRKTVGDSIGWFRQRYEGAQDYDLFLRLVSITRNIAHIPKILYHYRRIPQSTADTFKAKDYAIEAGRNALMIYWYNQDQCGDVVPLQTPGVYKLDPCTDPDFSVTFAILANTETSLRKILKQIKQAEETDSEFIIFGEERILKDINSSELKTVSLQQTRNYSEYINSALKETSKKYIYFIDGTVTFNAKELFENLAEYSYRDTVGAIGGKLLTTNNKIYCSGLVKSKEGRSIYTHQGLSNRQQGYFSSLSVAREVSASSVEFMAIKTESLKKCQLPNKEMDLFESSFYICTKIRAQGEAIILAPQLTGETTLPITKQTAIVEDPFLNPNLYLQDNQLAIKNTTNA